MVYETNDDEECQNCGMIDEPLTNGFCQGCICLRCHRNAGDTGCSMNGMGWCDDCEDLLHELVPPVVMTAQPTKKEGVNYWIVIWLLTCAVMGFWGGFLMGWLLGL